MQTTLITIGIIIAYLGLGILATATYVCFSGEGSLNDYGDDAVLAIAITLFWPIILVAMVVKAVCEKLAYIIKGLVWLVNYLTHKCEQLKQNARNRGR